MGNEPNDEARHQILNDHRHLWISVTPNGVQTVGEPRFDINGAFRPEWLWMCEWLILWPYRRLAWSSVSAKLLRVNEGHILKNKFHLLLFTFYLVINQRKKSHIKAFSFELACCQKFSRRHFQKVLFKRAAKSTVSHEVSMSFTARPAHNSINLSLTNRRQVQLGMCSFTWMYQLFLAITITFFSFLHY